MRFLGLGCSALLLLVAAPASAAELDTDTDTDTDTGFEPHPPPSVDIVSPDDGAVIVGMPDAVVSVEISFGYLQPEDVSLRVDDVEAGNCVDEWLCLIPVSLSPGSHELQAFGRGGWVSSVVTVEVEAQGAATDGPTTGSVDTDATTSETGDTTGDTGGRGEKSGCGCSAALIPLTPARSPQAGRGGQNPLSPGTGRGLG